MKTKIYKKLNQFLHDKLGIFIGTVLTILLYTFAVSMTSPVVVTNSPQEQLVVKAGETFILCRDVEYTRDTEVTISRALTREVDDGLLETINFDNITVPRKVGKQHICRNIRIPSDTPVGAWTFHTYIKAYTTPWWYTSFETPTVNLRVER